MRIDKIIWMLLLCMLTVTVAACSKDEPVTSTDNDVYCDIRGTWMNMIASADNHEVTYSGSLAAHVVAAADGEVLKFKLSPDAQHNEPWSSEIHPVTSHVFCVFKYMEIEAADVDELNEKIISRYQASSTAWVEDIITSEEEGRFVKAKSAIFDSRNMESAFEITISPNNLAGSRYFIFQFPGMDDFTESFVLEIYQPAKNIQ